MKKNQGEQIFQKMEERIRDTVAAIKNNELYFLPVNTRKVRLDILFNSRAISISLEKGNVNQVIEFADRLSQKLPEHHVIVYLSTPDRQSRIAYDSDELIRHRIFYPKMVKPYGNHNNDKEERKHDEIYFGQKK